MPLVAMIYGTGWCGFVAKVVFVNDLVWDDAEFDFD